ncbi:FimB/Mfa2 family fimbrial subunit [Prevotella sp. E15-22]|uniref:FimB/Mfa2 family fimbrial subunit n=1 Tax=Prevotella sp. E15-22 TaxID=2937774 RepID=UPI00206C4890|nr:FimB/Mfa2 family fimbrial subunit [Prevotella sp. E15-22]UPS45234.1 FimB/Mfa2 family fimbrial subunit [Prevotella sp. E15-22]
MKKIIWVILLMMTIVSCEKELLLDNSENDGQTSLLTSRLSITTRAVDDDGQLQAVAQGRVYVFNAQNQCVEVLSTTAEEGTFSTELPIGAYTLYAVGADDLDRYVLPTQEEATPTSIITCAEGKTLGDLLLKKANIELKRKATNKLTLDLKRQVLCLSQVQINNVPTDVTSVEVTLSPLYSGVTLSETYSGSKSCTVELKKGDDDGLWQSEPKTYLFPSKDTPTITISFTTSEGTQSYSYSTNQPLEANHHVILSGTYEGHQGVSLTGVLLSEKWGENITITFGFDTPTDNNNSNPSDPTVTPVPGRFYHDYYVVSVDQTNHKAVLLSRDNLTYSEPAKNDANNEGWLRVVKSAIAKLEKPSGLTCDSWRVPTIDEALIYVQDPSVITLSTKYVLCACMIGESLGWIRYGLNKAGEFDYEQNPSFGSVIPLRPVIDITY